MEHSLKFHDEYIGWEAHFAYPLGIYVAWQIGYLFMTGKLILNLHKWAPPVAIFLALWVLEVFGDS